MRITRPRNLRWFFFTVLATLFATWIYLGNFHAELLPQRLTLPPQLRQAPADQRSAGATPIGLWFGSIALGIFVFAILLSLRKKIPLWSLGTVQWWLRAHVWLTLLTIPLVLFHSGFRLGGPMTTLLMALYAIVMVSGIYGLALQQRLPTAMKERLPQEVVYEQIPYIRAQLVAAAEEMRRSLRAAVPITAAAQARACPPGAPAADQAALNSPVMASAAQNWRGGDAPGGFGDLPAPPASVPPDPIAAGAPQADPESEATLLDVIDREILPFLHSRNGRGFRLSSPRYLDETFGLLKLRVAETYRGRVEEMQRWCEERRLTDLQTKMQHWLHAWLFVHVPFSFLLVILTFWHAYVTLFYY